MQAEETLALKPTRTSFIQALPESMPVDEVIERGREIGIVIQPSDVHSARYYMRQTKAPPPTRKTVSAADRGIAATIKRNYELLEAQQSLPNVEAAAPKPEAEEPGNSRKKRTSRISESVSVRTAPGTKERAKRPPPLNNVKQIEQQLRAIVSRIGTDRAREILSELEELPIE